MADTATQSKAEGQTNGRSKVDVAKVLSLHDEGVKPAQIAEQLGAAVGTIYRILRDNGKGTGSPRGSRKGVNVSNELDATIERLQKRVDTVDQDKQAENERHENALKELDNQVEAARKMLKQLEQVKSSVSTETV